MRLFEVCLVAGSLILGSIAHAAGEPGTEVVDQGNFVITVNDRVVGVETFVIEARNDSLIVSSEVHGKELTGQGERPLEKRMGLVAGRADFGLQRYQSTTIFGSKTLVRGIIMGDTSLSVIREENGRGGEDRLVAPPGRLFVLDARLFSLFDLICLSLHDKTFETRPLAVLALGARDSLLEATATALGTETIRWGDRPVQARRLSLTDGTTTYRVWANPAGRMLRLEHRESGTRVEREPPPVKKRAPPKPAG